MKKYWHVWLVGALSLIWNGFDALDYVMTQTRNATYLAQFSPEQLSFFMSLPVWVTAMWAIAVWFGVAGSVLILFRKKISVPILAISLMAMIVTAFHNFILSDVKMNEIVGPDAAYITVGILVFAVLLWIFAWRMRANNTFN